MKIHSDKRTNRRNIWHKEYCLFRVSPYLLIKRFRPLATKFSTDSMPKCALISIYKSFDIAPNILYTILFIVNCSVFYQSYRDLARTEGSCVDLNSLGNDPSVCNFCNFPLKLFTETAETDSSSKELQGLITLSAKKRWRKSVRTLLLCNFNECPLVLELWANSKKVSKLTKIHG